MPCSIKAWLKVHYDMWCQDSVEILLLMNSEARRQRLAEIVSRAKGDRSQNQFASDLGVSLGAVQKWLKGTGFPSSDNLEKIAVSAAMSLEELLIHIRGEDEEPSISPRVAEDVLHVAEKLNKDQQIRLIKLLVDKLGNEVG